MQFTQKLLVTACLSAAIAAGAHATDTHKDQVLKDAWLDGKAEATLLMSQHLNNFTIDTLVENGVVTLRGDVDSEVDKHLAEELVLSLDGVKDVHNQLRVNPDTYATDSLLADMQDSKTESLIKARLLIDTEVSGTDIEVEVDQGKVILSGEVDSSAEKSLAETIAKNTSNVEQVVNRLEINS